MMADIPLIKRNIAKMMAQGAPEADLDAYVASEGVTPEQLRGAAPTGMPSTGIVGNVVQGVSEPIANIATGTAGAAIGGLAGIAGAALPGPTGQGADWAQKVGNALTYQPRTPAGQAVSSALAYPSELIAKGADAAGGAVADATGSPLAGTAVNVGIQAIPAIAAKALGGKTGAVMDKTRGDLALAQSQNALKDANLLAAKKDGFVVPLALIDKEGAGLSAAGGKVKIEQRASIKNQSVANSLVREDLGLPEGVTITPSVLKNIRSTAYDAYLNIINHDYGDAAIVKQPKFGTDWNTIPDVSTRKLGIVTTEEFKTAINSIYDKYNQIHKEDPHTFSAPLPNGIRNDLLRPERSAQSAINIIKELRSDATANMMDKTKPAMVRRGMAKIDLANAVEDLVAQNLEKSGASDLLQKFQEARTTIAKTYNVEKALNWATGDVSMAKLAQQKGPMSGGIQRAATFAKQFPKAAQSVERLSAPYWSPWDTAFAIGSVATGHPIAAVAELGARGLVPSISLSKPYQNMFVKPPSYQPGLGQSLLTGITQPELAPFYLPRQDQ